MSNTTVNIADMYCENCTGKIVAALKACPGVGEIQVNPLRRDVFISHNSMISSAELMGEIQNLGFNPRLEESFREIVSWAGWMPKMV